MSLVKKIEQFISDSLRHRYDGRTPYLTFLEMHAEAVKRIVNREGSVEIRLTNGESFQKFLYRFPQTRFYYTLYQNLHWQIKILDILQHTIVLVQHLERQKVDVRCVPQNQKAQVLLLSNDKAQEEAVHRDRFSKIFWIWPEGESVPNAPEKVLLSFLQTALRSEYNLHLIGMITDADYTAMADLDRLFARLHALDALGHLRADAFRNEEFVWLHELFLQLGWWNRLKNFYLNVNSASFKEEPLLTLLAQRFNAFLQASGHPPLNLPEEPNQKIVSSFLARYLSPQADEEERDIDLQHFWEYFQLPAFRFRWEREIVHNANEFIAFALLALCRKFWWAETALNTIDAFLPETHHVVFRLLRILLKRVCLRPNEKRIGILFFRDPQGDYQLKHSELQVRSYSFGKQVFARVAIGAPLELQATVDRRVDFYIDYAHKTLYIKPVIFRPPFQEPTLRTIKIEYAGNTIFFPLVWERATLHLNRCRLKFLRKKDRFQITIKNPDKDHLIYLENQAVPMRPDRYAKYYVPLQKRSATMAIEAFSPQGRQLTGLAPGPNAVVIRGWALDVFGIMKEEVRLRLNNQRRTHGIHPNAFNPDILNVPGGEVQLTISGRKCLPSTLKLTMSDPFWHAFVTRPAEQLIHELKIWISDRHKESIDMEKLKQILAHRLHWIPEIEWISASYFKPLNQAFNIFIGSDFIRGDELIAKKGDIRIFRSKKSPKIKYFHIEDRNWHNIFDLNFFMGNFTKI